MNHDRYHQNKIEKAPAFSSRRGRNFLLHNLEESDVVFGTKGNGRNEIFLKVLESHSEQYMKLSKFQKMGLIQQIIRDWKGNFYIMNPKTNDLCLAKEKKHDLSTTDSSSRKLYTSVRRMMNYVNSKIQRQPYHPQARESTGTAALIPRTSDAGSMVPTPQIFRTNTILTKKEHGQKPRKQSLVPNAEIADLVAQKKPTVVMTAREYISKNHATVRLPKSTLLNFPCNPTSLSSSSPKRSAMMVTPEPSPRPMLQSPPTISPIPFSTPILSESKTVLIPPPLPQYPFSSPTIENRNDTKNSYTEQQRTIFITLSARNKKTKKYLPPAADNTIGDLEESAILALTSLGASS
jgi:hypothetical protein